MHAEINLSRLQEVQNELCLLNISSFFSVSYKILIPIHNYYKRDNYNKCDMFKLLTFVNILIKKYDFFFIILYRLNKSLLRTVYFLKQMLLYSSRYYDINIIIIMIMNCENFLF